MKITIPKPIEITPEIIISKLFSYHNIAHFYHLQCGTIGKHLLLDELYKKLVKSKDKIGEYLLGLQIPKRFEYMKLDEIKPYSPENLMLFLNEGFDFTVKVVDYANQRKLEQLSNLIADTQGAFNKARLFTTYKGDESK